MVKLHNFSGEPGLPLSVNLSNGSCSDETTKAVLKPMKSDAFEAPADKVNGYSKELSLNVDPTSNENLGQPVNEVGAVKENGDSAVKIPVFNGNGEDKAYESFSNSSNTPSENGSCCVCASDSLNNEENFVGFKVVDNKKRNKRKKNRRKKHSPNLPPAMNIASIRCDKDKNIDDKTSTHLSQFNALRINGKSYSSALVNGQNRTSHGAADMQNVTKCAISNKSSNSSNLRETLISVSHLSTAAVESAVTNGLSDVKCKKVISTKFEMTDVSAQAETSQDVVPPILKEFQPCNEVIYDSKKSSSSTDCVEDAVLVRETTDLSSNSAYCESVDSNDSGRGDSEVTYDEHTPYCCEFPKNKVKNLIGRHGSYKHEVEEQSGARFWVPSNFFVDKDTTIVAFMGTGAQIETAKQLIKLRFPQVSLKQWIGPQAVPWLNGGPSLSDIFCATLPIGTRFMGVVSCIFDPSYFWLQQWGHPEIHPLEDLENWMSNHFNTIVDAPRVINPMIGNVVAVPVFVEGENIKWVRGEIIDFNLGNKSVIARYLDHGGESEVPASEIRPMRQEFLSIPFFAAKCCLYGVVGPWSEEACAEFKRLCSNVHRPPIVEVICKVPMGYFVSIFGFDDETNTRVNVAHALINKGLAQLDCDLCQQPEPSNAIVH